VKRLVVGEVAVLIGILLLAGCGATGATATPPTSTAPPAITTPAATTAPVQTTTTTVPISTTTEATSPAAVDPQLQPGPCSVPAVHGDPNVDNPDGLIRNTSCPVGTPAYPFVYGYNP
jgi:hypothetical protein